MPPTLNDLPRPYRLDCPDFESMWQQLENTCKLLGNQRANQANPVAAQAVILTTVHVVAVLSLGAGLVASALTLLSVVI
jgi:hypothetical protein